MQVKDIDPGVSIGIKVLGSRTDRSEIDFAKILGKKDLEGVALKSIQNKNIKLEAATKLKQ